MGGEEGTTAYGGNRRMWPADTELGLWADGGPADVAGWIDGRQLEKPADVAGGRWGE